MEHFEDGIKGTEGVGDADQTEVMHRRKVVIEERLEIFK